MTFPAPYLRISSLNSDGNNAMVINNCRAATAVNFRHDFTHETFVIGAKQEKPAGMAHFFFGQYLQPSGKIYA